MNAESQDREQTGQLEEGGDRQVRVKARVKVGSQGGFQLRNNVINLGCQNPKVTLLGIPLVTQGLGLGTFY